LKPKNLVIVYFKYYVPSGPIAMTVIGKHGFCKMWLWSSRQSFAHRFGAGLERQRGCNWSKCL